MENQDNDKVVQDPVNDTILTHIKMQDDKITELSTTLKKVVDFNNQLLNTTESPSRPVQDKAERQKQLQEKLYGGLL
jgi:Asp-tRNA(Asn)/Glu-tRNA(Gln) amidotransferase C subunit